MGRHISIKMNGHTIFNLGGSSFYTDPPNIVLDENQVSEKFMDAMENLKLEMQMLAAYTPKSVEELEGIKIKIDALIEDTSTIILKCGRQFALTNILDNAKITYSIE